MFIVSVHALMEAMAVGLPCISTDCPCGGPKELFDGDGGILVSVGDEKAISDAILKVCESKDLQKSLSEKARFKAERFSQDKVFKIWNEYLLSDVFKK